jgi:hypothetical protein
MKLSEAICIGSKGKIQLRGKWSDFAGGVCAMGAVRAAMGDGDINGTFPELSKMRINGCNLYTVITQKNDSGETFEQIITWLESIGQ